MKLDIFFISEATFFCLQKKTYYNLCLKNIQLNWLDSQGYNLFLCIPNLYGDEEWGFAWFSYFIGLKTIFFLT